MREFVTLCEVGPRDGFQYESTPIPTPLKLEIIRALAAAGLPRIQAVSFVHPKRVPQMADAEAVAESMAAGKRRDRPVLSGLALNLRGVDRAIAAGLGAVDLSIATHETHSRDNAGMSVEEGVLAADQMVARAVAAGLETQIGFQTVFGYAAPGDVPLDQVLGLVARFASAGVASISIADSTGMANPATIKHVVREVSAIAPGIPLVLHLHDTRGLGLANIVAALEEGVRWFDTSLGGMGGCPFIPGATGNIATEDTAYLLDALGYETGIDQAAVAVCSKRIESHIGRPLSGRLYRLL